MTDSVHCIIQERYGKDEERTERYRLATSSSSNNSRNFALTKIAQSRSNRRSQTVKSFFTEVFLPQGFPDSVTDDYLEYQVWDTLQAFASSITGALATQAILKGVGVGDESATVLAATLTWLLKDGAGMLGRILFAWARGFELDADSKKWRLFADVLNDFALFLDLLAPHFKPFFTLIVCTSSVCRSLVGVAGGATRAALTQHQARRNNLADVSAKDGSQETLVNLSALICSFILIPLVSGKFALIWMLYFALTSLHIFANYKAVTALRMDTLNRHRFRILVRQFARDGNVLSLKQTNKAEPLFGDFLDFSQCVDFKFGCSLQDAFVSSRHDGLFGRQLRTTPNATPFFVNCFCVSERRRKFRVAVVLGAEANVRTMLESAFVAFHLEQSLSEQLARPHGLTIGQRELETMIVDALKFAEANFEHFHAGLEAAGWNTTYCLLNFDEYRLVVNNTQDSIVY